VAAGRVFALEGIPIWKALQPGVFANSQRSWLAVMQKVIGQARDGRGRTVGVENTQSHFAQSKARAHIGADGRV